jgi:hypothetical protein
MQEIIILRERREDELAAPRILVVVALEMLLLAGKIQ